jgi:hypothetical protein
MLPSAAGAIPRSQPSANNHNHPNTQDPLSGHKLQVAREMYATGQYTVSAIATTLGVSRASIYRHLNGDTG